MNELSSVSGIAVADVSLAQEDFFLIGAPEDHTQRGPQILLSNY
jgi:hypothetical protein